MNERYPAGGALRRPLGFLLLILIAWGLCWTGGEAHASEAHASETHAWALGWDDGMTLRHRFGGGWQLGLAAGPDDYLHKAEYRAVRLGDTDDLRGLLQVPEDVREEHGWVRLQAARELRREGPFHISAFGGITYEWYNHQERQLLLNDLVHDYDTYELDRHTDRYILMVGLRPAWQARDWLTIETAFGLRFIHDEWDQSEFRTYAGVSGGDTAATDGKDQYFQDFGFEGAASVQFFFWFW